MNGNVLLKIDLIHSTKGAKKITQSRPKAFDGIDMNFAYAVSVGISCPNTLAWRMTDRHMQTIFLSKMMIRFPFICINCRAGLRGLENSWLKVFSPTVKYILTIVFTR